MHERHEGVLLWGLTPALQDSSRGPSRDDADRFDVLVPGDSAERAPTLRGRASERGALPDVVRFGVWEARASSMQSRRCSSSKVARASGLVRAMLVRGVWDARSGWRRGHKAARAIDLVRAMLVLGVPDARSGWKRGHGRLVGEGHRLAAGIDGANARVDVSEERVVLRIGAALHGVNANTLIDASNERVALVIGAVLVVLGIGAVLHVVHAGELLACLVLLDESS